MAYWRMKLRDGDRGEDLWEACQDARVAAIVYPGIENVDLRPYSLANHPPGWDQVKGSGKGSLNKFAWTIRGGDAIYVGDSVKGQIVGMGYATAKIGELSYRFDPQSPISPTDGEPWCHLIDVDWEKNFAPFDYRDRAPQNAVLSLNQDEIANFDKWTQLKEHRDQSLTEEEANDTVQLATDYYRYTPAAHRLILRKHVALSNHFKSWL